MIDPGLTEKVVLVTGANNPRGIGAATARAFAAQGARVMLHYHRRGQESSDPEPETAGADLYLRLQTKRADAIVDEIRASGREAACWEGDLGDPATVPALFDATEASLGAVDVLVNNAGFNREDTFLPQGLAEGETPVLAGSANAITADSHDKHFAVMSRATALMMAEFARRHSERGVSWGRIVNVSTDAADTFPGSVSYGASKHAMESYSRSAAVELARFGITVNIVAPGPIQSGYISPALAAREERRTPLGRVGEPEDVADVIVFLASEQARWLTGQLLYAGGGHKM
jgi:3-oxoacyl-[acyl-carrier protein] reductase